MGRTGKRLERASTLLSLFPCFLFPCLELIVYRRQWGIDILWRTVIKTRLDLHGYRRSELHVVRSKAGDGRAWVEQSGGELLAGSTLFSGCYCRRTYHLAWLWKSHQGRVNSCEICSIVK